MTIWEYKVEIGSYGFGGRPESEQLRKHLDKVGEEGWELASVFTVQANESKEDWVIFKRPMEIKKPKA